MFNEQIGFSFKFPPHSFEVSNWIVAVFSNMTIMFVCLLLAWGGGGVIPQHTYGGERTALRNGFPLSTLWVLVNLGHQPWQQVPLDAESFPKLLIGSFKDFLDILMGTHQEPQAPPEISTSRTD